ncbi:MAG: DUF2975 domain-containing protein [Prevotella sp.]|nr:DUF2975 domain-containing protein [Prevotella sp.]
MRHKMNILCVVILIFSIIMPVLEMSEIFFSPKDDFMLTEVRVRPTHIGDDNAVTLTEKDTGKSMKAWVKDVLVERNKDIKNKPSSWLAFALIPVAIIGIVTWVMFIVYLIKFAISINKGEVFTWKTINLLRKAGWASLISTIMLLVIGFIPHNMMDFNGYTFDFSDAIESITSLLPGLLLLLMAQTYGIGLEQKEELEQVV